VQKPCSPPCSKPSKHSHSPVSITRVKEAFLLARSLVSKRELRQGFEPSHPQMAGGAETWSLCSWPVGDRSKALNALDTVLKRDDTGVGADSAGVCSATPELRISNAAAQTRIVSKVFSQSFPSLSPTSGPEVHKYSHMLVLLF
jgi:hypothetical protein